MFSSRRMWLCSIALLCWHLSLVSAPAAPDQSASELRKDPGVDAALQVLDAWIEATMKDREQPGLSIGIVYDQELLWKKGYGYAEVETKIPATPATLYRIASISKLFTATSILQLRDNGKLRLDDPVAKHLPWFKIKNVHPEGPAITTRHLLTHTSGLPRESVGFYWNDLQFPSRQVMIEALPGQQTVFPAETEWKYSNLAISIAGEIVAAVSGEAYADYVQKHILDPLGMTSTLVLPEAGTPGLAVGYTSRLPGQAREPEGFTRSGGLTPAANLASSVEDLAKFAALQFRDGPAGGAQVLKSSTLREMQRVHWLNPDWESGWGLGFGVRRVDDEVRFGHGGHVPGHTTNIEIAPKMKIAVIVLTNGDDGNPRSYVNQAFQLVGPPLAEATKPPEKPSKPDPAWDKYTGTYTWRGDEAKIFLLNGELTMFYPDAESPWKSRVTLEPDGPQTFRIKTHGPGFGAKGELLRFEVDAAGEVKRAILPGFYLNRKK